MANEKQENRVDTVNTNTDRRDFSRFLIKKQARRRAMHFTCAEHTSESKVLRTGSNVRVKLAEVASRFDHFRVTSRHERLERDTCD